MKKLREIENFLHLVEHSDDHGDKLKIFRRDHDSGLSKLGIELKERVRCNYRLYEKETALSQSCKRPKRSEIMFNEALDALIQTYMTLYKKNNAVLV